MSARRSPAARTLDAALDFTVIPGYSKLGYGLRRLRWEDAGAFNLAGRTALVTGASSGIGEATCEGLLAAGAEVHMLVRDLERGERARTRLEERVGATGRARIELCDVSSLAEVRRFAGEFLAKHDRIDLLVNNAGVLPGERDYTPDGVELTFATNVLGPYLLTRLLLPALRLGHRARVITVSSGGMYTAKLDGSDPQLERREFDGARFYAHTKRAEVVLNRLWAEHAADSGVGFCAMHPGWADTAGLASSLPGFHRLMRPVLRDPHQAADTIVWLATSPVLEPASGGFWHDRAPRCEHRVPWTRESAEERGRLWAYCERESAGGASAGG